METKGSGFRGFFKTVAGILAFAVLVSGITIYFAKRKEAIVYDFDPENAYVYTFNPAYYSLDYEESPGKSVTALSDGFNPLCVFGCSREMERDELRSSLVRTSPRADEEEGRTGGRFAYLRPGEAVELKLDTAEGDRVRDRFPYSNRLILEFDDENRREDLALEAYGYSYEAGEEVPNQAELTGESFVYSGDFGRASVFVLPSPFFVSRVQFRVKEEAEGEIGLRKASLYLERNRYLGLVSEVREALPTEVEERLMELEGKLRESRLLDPYSPETDYQLAEVYSLLGRFEAAMERIDAALSRMENYSEFLVPRLDYNDLFKRKARIAGHLEEWSTAVDYMERADPEVDYGFLSEAYLRRYEESGSREDLDASFLNAALAYRRKPRLALKVLRKYAEEERWLELASDYFRGLAEEEGGQGFRTEDGRRLPAYSVHLSVSLLELWRAEEESLELAKEKLAAAEEVADDEEKLALVDALKSRIYRSDGRAEEASEAREEALSYFSNYSSLYDGWVGFSEAEGG